MSQFSTILSYEKKPPGITAGLTCPSCHRWTSLALEWNKSVRPTVRARHRWTSLWRRSSAQRNAIFGGRFQKWRGVIHGDSWWFLTFCYDDLVMFSFPFGRRWLDLSQQDWQWQGVLECPTTHHSKTTRPSWMFFPACTIHFHDIWSHQAMSSQKIQNSVTNASSLRKMCWKNNHLKTFPTHWSPPARPNMSQHILVPLGPWCYWGTCLPVDVQEAHFPVALAPAAILAPRGKVALLAAEDLHLTSWEQKMGGIVVKIGVYKDLRDTASFWRWKWFQRNLASDFWVRTSLHCN